MGLGLLFAQSRQFSYLYSFKQQPRQTFAFALLTSRALRVSIVVNFATAW